MKKIIELLLVLGIPYGIIYYYTHKPKQVINANITQTKVYNGTKDTVTVYVTLGATLGCLQKVMNVPWAHLSLLVQKSRFFKQSSRFINAYYHYTP